MACSVFGTPITDETLKGMTKYHDQTITRLDKAVVAFEMKNAEGKDVNAHKYVDELLNNHGGNGIKCLIYNATGGPVKMVSWSDGDGCIATGAYPMVLANGQWGAYVHTVCNREHDTGAHAVVYAGKNAAGTEQQWMFCLSCEWRGRCYTEIRPAGYYPMSDNNYNRYCGTLNELRTFTHHGEDHGCVSFASIGSDSKCPYFEGIMTLDGAWGW